MVLICPPPIWVQIWNAHLVVRRRNLLRGLPQVLRHVEAERRQSNNGEDEWRASRFTFLMSFNTCS
jgi:hypothetical protein